jgi:hypothetical protein
MRGNFFIELSFIFNPFYKAPLFFTNDFSQLPSFILLLQESAGYFKVLLLGKHVYRIKYKLAD